MFKSRDFKSKSRDLKSCDLKSQRFGNLRFEKHQLKSHKSIYHCKIQQKSCQKQLCKGLGTSGTWMHYNSKEMAVFFDHVFTIVYLFVVGLVWSRTRGSRPEWGRELLAIWNRRFICCYLQWFGCPLAFRIVFFDGLAAFVVLHCNLQYICRLCVVLVVICNRSEAWSFLICVYNSFAS